MSPTLRTLCARELRKNQTQAESFLWQKLRNKQFRGLKFRRQHPLFGFIVDFYCYELNLVIELDGQVHNDLDQHEQDDYRSQVLEEKGIAVLRFWNSEVINDIGKVLKRIEEIEKRFDGNEGV